MSDSLQDQLRALGLAREATKENSRKSGPAKKKARPGHPPQQKLAQRSRKPIDPENITLEQAYRIREKEEAASQQRKKARKIEEDRKRAALNRQIRQIIDASRLNHPDAAESRYFMYKGRIRKIFLTVEQLPDVNNGKLGVVYLSGGYHLLPADQVDAVRKLSVDHVPDLLAGDEDDFSEAAYSQDNPQGDSQGDQDKQEGESSE